MLDGRAAAAALLLALYAPAPMRAMRLVPRVVHTTEPVRMVAGERGRKDYNNLKEWQKSADRKWKQMEFDERAAKEEKRGGFAEGLATTERRRARREWWAANGDKSRTRISTWRPKSGPGADDDDDDKVDDDPYGAPATAPVRGGGARMKRLEDGDGAWYDLAAAGAAAGAERTDFYAGSTFAEAGASDALARALGSLGIGAPSHVQAQSYRRVLHGHTCLLADRTGSGKTLAYLTPLVQRVHEQEALRGVTGEPGAPLLIVITPTAELAAQVLAAARALARGGVPFRSAVITGAYPWRTQREALSSGLELLVATPGRLASHLEAGTLSLAAVQTVVVDEIDVLLEDEDFKAPWAALRAAAPPTANYIFVTATLPKPVEDALRADFQTLKVIKGPGLHMAVPGVRHVLVECAGTSADVALKEKLGALDAALAQAASRRTLVFCNSIDECRAVENHLERRERRREAYRVLAYHAALTPQKRRAHLQEFVDGSSDEHLVLVATDRASRGIDFACAEHVLLFDFPRRGDEWLRRVGRVGRGARGGGLVTSLVLPYQSMRARKMLHKTLGQERLWIG
jgi:ATP-dependent RNA helicase DDX18/HAS1